MSTRDHFTLQRITHTLPKQIETVVTSTTSKINTNPKNAVVITWVQKMPSVGSLVLVFVRSGPNTLKKIFMYLVLIQHESFPDQKRKIKYRHELHHGSLEDKDIPAQACNEECHHSGHKCCRWMNQTIGVCRRSARWTHKCTDQSQEREKAASCKMIQIRLILGF